MTPEQHGSDGSGDDGNGPGSGDAEPPVCACLRTKMQYVTPDQGRWGRPSSTAQFWCLHTMSQVGPDDDQVRDDRCLPGRACHTPRAT